MSWLLAPGFAELWAMPALQSGHWLVACSQSMPRQGRSCPKLRCVEILMTGTTFIDFPLCDLRISRWLPMLPPRFSPRMTRIMEPMERLGIKRNLVLFQELPRLWLIFSALMWLTERHDKTEARGSVAGLMWQCAQMRGDVESTWKVDDLTMAQRYGTMFSAMPIAWLRWTAYCHTSDSCKFVRFCHMRSNLFKPCRVLLCWQTTFPWMKSPMRPYTLVHLTGIDQMTTRWLCEADAFWMLEIRWKSGDYPLIDYDFPAKCVLFLALLFAVGVGILLSPWLGSTTPDPCGAKVVSVPTGLLASGFTQALPTEANALWITWYILLLDATRYFTLSTFFLHIYIYIILLISCLISSISQRSTSEELKKFRAEERQKRADAATTIERATLQH